MARFISCYVCVVFALMICEYSLYIKDYSQLLIMKNYIEYDIKNGDLKSFKNADFIVNVDVIDNGIMYEIIMNRNCLINIKKLKIIKYHGIVD